MLWRYHHWCIQFPHIKVQQRQPYELIWVRIQGEISRQWWSMIWITRWHWRAIIRRYYQRMEPVVWTLEMWGILLELNQKSERKVFALWKPRELIFVGGAELCSSVEAGCDFSWEMIGGHYCLWCFCYWGHPSTVRFWVTPVCFPDSSLSFPPSPPHSPPPP